MGIKKRLFDDDDGEMPASTGPRHATEFASHILKDFTAACVRFCVGRDESCDRVSHT
jgi:hypothetical protein